MITWTESDIPTGWTGTLRMADGRWAAKCRNCGLIEYTADALPRYRSIGKHEYATHGLDVPGINVGMLP